MENICDEMVLYIINFLTLPEKNELRFVCRKWRRLIKYRGIEERMELYQKRNLPLEVNSSINWNFYDFFYEPIRDLMFVSDNECITIYKEMELVKEIYSENVGRIFFSNEHLFSLNVIEKLINIYDIKTFELFNIFGLGGLPYRISKIIGWHGIIYIICNCPYNEENEIFRYEYSGKKLCSFKENGSIIIDIEIDKNEEKTVYAVANNSKILTFKDGVKETIETGRKIFQINCVGDFIYSSEEDDFRKCFVMKMNKAFDILEIITIEGYLSSLEFPFMLVDKKLWYNFEELCDIDGYRDKYYIDCKQRLVVLNHKKNKFTYY